jgi:hypothetical protein
MPELGKISVSFRRKEARNIRESEVFRRVSCSIVSAARLRLVKRQTPAMVLPSRSGMVNNTEMKRRMR